MVIGNANCESLSQKSKIFASSLWQGSLWGAATKPPLPKGGASACRGGGIPQAGRFPHRLVLLESACCESLSRLRRQLPLAREPFCARYRSMVRLPGFLYLSIDSVGTRHYKIPQTQTGAEAKIHHPEPKRRVNLPMVRGDS